MKHKRTFVEIARRALVVLCILLICVLAGFSSGHMHPLANPDTALVQNNAPCELCAIAFQSAIILIYLFFALHLVEQLTPPQSDPKSKSRFAGSSIFFRPPPFAC